MNRKEKHQLLAKLAGVPWQFQCPECLSTYFGSASRKFGGTVNITKRYCHDQYNGRCRWEGSDDECRRVADYDHNHNAWVVIRLALDGKCLWDEFFDAWVEINGPYHRDVADAVYKFLSDLPGQVDAAIEVMK